MSPSLYLDTPRSSIHSRSSPSWLLLLLLRLPPLFLVSCALGEVKASAVAARRNVAARWAAKSKALQDLRLAVQQEIGAVLVRYLRPGRSWPLYRQIQPCVKKYVMGPRGSMPSIIELAGLHRLLPRYAGIGPWPPFERSLSSMGNFVSGEKNKPLVRLLQISVD